MYFATPIEGFAINVGNMRFPSGKLFFHRISSMQKSVGRNVVSRDAQFRL